MVKIIDFEGSDYSGKTSTLNFLADKFKENSKWCFNTGAIYPTDLSRKLISISKRCSSEEKEFLYTMGHILDNTQAITNHPEDDRIIFQDRYWASVISYGRFLNEERSVHNKYDFRSLFLQPISTIHFSCSIQEKIKRNKKRARVSIIDKLLLGDASGLRKLESEIGGSIESLPNIYKIDTSDISVEKVASRIIDYLNVNHII
jgi:thymidylate kinase